MRGLLDSTAGRVSAGVLAAIGLVGSLYAVRSTFGRTEAAAAAQDRTYICAETGKVFTHRLSLSDGIPIVSPHSGKRSGYPAEMCYWTRSGQVQREPTPVLLNSYRGQAEPTFCPVCDRLVVPHNPPPEAGRQPPPLRAEYRQSGRGWGEPRG